MGSEGTAIPKYYRISREIVERIRMGQLRPGMKAPSENELIRQYGISNTTARKVLCEVEAEGWCTRIKGKGTFVGERNIPRSARRILGFTQNMVEAGFTPSTKVVDTSVVEEGYGAVICGRRCTMSGPVFRIRRLRLADGVAMMIEERFIALQFCPGIEKEDFTGSLYDIYERRYGLHVFEVRQMLSATALDDETQRFFGLVGPAPALRVEGAAFCGKEMVLEMEDSVCRGDRYRFSVRAGPE